MNMNHKSLIGWIRKRRALPLEVQEVPLTGVYAREDLWKEVHLQQMLMSAIVHDIKTPLRYFVWTARSLEQDIARGENAETLKDKASMMSTSAERMHNLVEDLLRYSKAQLLTGDKGRFQMVNLHQAVAIKAALFHPIARSKQIEITNKVAPLLAIWTDPDCLAVILHNIMDNAVKFTSRGCIEVRSKVENCVVQVSVADTGRGMSWEYMEWFNKQRVYTEKKFTEEAFRPTGLGLLLVNKLLDKVGGKLKISRGENEGTRMVLEFPK